MSYKNKSIFILIGLLPIFSVLSAKAADIDNKDPLHFVKITDWVSDSEVKKFLMPDAFWCFEPKNNTCSFYTVAKGEQNNDLQQGQFFAYDVIELWDNETILKTPTGGILRADGKICEQYTDWIENISAQDRLGNPVKTERLEEMKTELKNDWAIDASTQYCFSYAKTNPSQPEIITQFEYVNGKFNGYSMNFIVDYRANAIENYQLRLD